MPNRILREGILTSARVNSLDAGGEVFYRRLMSVVDDFGRYYASPMLLRAACFPMKLDTVSDRQVSAWVHALQSACLIAVYEVSGTHYLEMLDFRQQLRAKKSKYPSREGATDVNTERAPSARKANGLDGFKEFYDAYPRRIARARAEKAWSNLRPDERLRTAILDAIARQKEGADWKRENGKFIPHPATWLNDRRWEDDAQQAALPYGKFQSPT